MKFHPNGARTLLPVTKQVKQNKSEKSLRASKQVAPSHPILPPPPVPQAVPPPLTLRLSSATSELARWYCDITHHRLATTIDAIAGANLEAAREAYESNTGDAAFDIALMHVLDGDTSEPRLITDGTMDSIHGDRVAVSLLAEFSRQSDHTLQDVAVAAVEWALGRFLREPADTPEDRRDRIEFELACSHACQRRHSDHARA